VQFPIHIGQRGQAWSPEANSQSRPLYYYCPSEVNDRHSPFSFYTQRMADREVIGLQNV